jgi:hypothetical protein
MNHKPNMNVGGESDGRVVPAKRPNKGGKPSAEGAEGRRSTKENTEQTAAYQTQSWGNALSGLHRVREAARRDKQLQFTALLHHVTIPLLLDSFYALRRDAAPGVDGVGARIQTGRDRLLITHKFSSEGEAQLDVGQAGQASPNDRVSGGCIAGTREIAPESRDPDQVS